MIEKYQELNQANRAILATNFYNFETLKGVLLAVKDRKTDIILQITKGSIDYMGLENAINMARTALKFYGIRGWIHLDHGGTVELAKRCLDAGVDSVMYDGSELSVEENIKNTQEVVKYAKKFNASVEAELGYVAKLGQDKSKMEYTRVEDAKRFVEETGVNALAVAIGTAHGFYKEKPKLDFVRLAEIKEAVKTPLVLHGGSGVPDEDLIKSIQNGICKINLATEIKDTFIKNVKNEINKSEQIDLRIIFPPAVDAVKKLIINKLITIEN